MLGIESDFQGSGESRSDSGTVGAIPFTVDQKIPWFATLRGRIGYAFGPTIFYFTGGGAEWMFAPKWSAKLEYLHMDTGDTSITLFGMTFTGRAQNNIVRAGVNYQF